MKKHIFFKHFSIKIVTLHQYNLRYLITYLFEVKSSGLMTSLRKLLLHFNSTLNIKGLYLLNYSLTIIKV